MAEAMMDEAPLPLAFRIALTGREADAKEVALAPGETLSPHVWEYLRSLKVERESFVLYDTARGRRVDPDWACDQAGVAAGALVLVGDPTDFPDPLHGYRALLERIKGDREWPIKELTGLELLKKRGELAVSRLEHASVAREAGVPPDDAVVLWDWKPLRERQREEYGILLNLVKGSATVPEGAVKKLSELRSALSMPPEEHMDLATRAGLDGALAARLLDGTAPVPRVHQEYIGALVSAREASFAPDALNRLKDMVRKHGISRDQHCKLAAQAAIVPEVADACFEDQENVPVGRRFYGRALLAAVARAQSTPEELAKLKELRDRYGIKRPEHLRLSKEWGVSEHAAAALWDLKPPPEGLSMRQVKIGLGIALAVLLLSPPGMEAMRMAVRGVGDIVRPASEYGPDGLNKDGRDRQGYDKNGYDKDGYDRSQRDRLGFDRNGYDRDGFDRQGYGKNGRDRDGFDKQGFDPRGFDKDGLNKKGFDKDGYDKDGFDAKGFDRGGYNRAGFDAKGFDRKGRDKEGYDRDGFDEKGFDRQGFDKEGRDKGGFDREGRDRDGYDKLGFDKNGYNRDGFDKDGFDTRGYDKDGYDRGGCNRRGFNREGEPCTRTGAGARPGGRPSERPDVAPTPRSSGDGRVFGPDGFDKFGYDAEGYDRSGRDRRGFNRAGFDAQGYNREGFDNRGFNRQRMDARGFNEDGFDKDGFDRQGYNKLGFTKEGRGREGTDLLPGPLATLQGEAGGWTLGVGRPPGRRLVLVGDTVPPHGVKVERIGGNLILFRHNGYLYERKILK